MPQTITLDELTQATLSGTGAFDVLMRAVKEHVAQEYSTGRIEGSDYAKVYLGALQSTLDRALEFLLSQQKTAAEIALIEAQVKKVEAEVALAEQGVINAQAELLKIQADIKLTEQQERNLIAEAAIIPKQGELIDQQILNGIQEALLTAAKTDNTKENTKLITEQTESEAKRNAPDGVIDQEIARLIADIALTGKQTDKLAADIGLVEQQILIGVQEALLTAARTDNTAQSTNLVREQVESEAKRNAPDGVIDQEIARLVADINLTDKQVEKLAADIGLTTQQTANLLAELANISKTGAKIDAETLGIVANTALTDQRTANAVIEGLVLTAQECKLKAEYDLLMEQKLKTASETALLDQKKATELAQTSGGAIDPSSVLGKQIALYQRQADGFLRDAEQKAAKIMADSWGLRRTTDEVGTEADSVNKLDDPSVGAAISKLLAGINS